MKGKKSQINHPCLKLTEFEYPKEQQKMKRQNSSPLNILLMRSNLRHSSFKNEDKAIQECTLQIGSPRKNDNEELGENLVATQRQKLFESKVLPSWIRPRDKDYLHAPYIFHRFSYENYSNYCYENPFKPRKVLQSDTVMKASKFTVRKGKTIEVVYCEKKLPEFVKIATSQINKPIYHVSQKSFKQIERYSPKVKIGLRQPNPQTLHRKNSDRHLLKSRNKKITTLAAYITEFATLEKLSAFMERDKNIKEKNLLHIEQNIHKGTVLLDIIIHRFEFLKKIASSFRKQLFKILFDCQINSNTKINIHQYLKLIEVFVNRDAQDKITAKFMYQICAYPENIFQLEKVSRLLQKLPLHQTRKDNVYQQIKQILAEAPLNMTKQMIIFEFQMNRPLLKQFIDLFVCI